MKRHFPHWIYDGFLPYCEEMESTERILTFAAIGGISAALEAKVWMRFGHSRVYPHQFIVIVGPSGKSRKTSATNMIIDMLAELPDFNISPDQITPQALVTEMAKSAKPVIEKGIQKSQTPYLLYMPELKDFFTEYALGNGIHQLLTNLWDVKERGYKKVTKYEKADSVPRPCLSLLGCTTPEWLIKCIPPAEATGGLASRIIFVPEFREPTKFISIPQISDKVLAMRKPLMEDLERIHYEIQGEITLAPDAYAFYDQWYQPYRDAQATTDERIVGFVERKHMHVHKLAIANMACRSSHRVLEIQDYEQAFKWVGSIEAEMQEVFKGGNNKFFAVGEKILKVIRRLGRVEKGTILSMFNGDVNSKELTQILMDLTERGDVKCMDGYIFTPRLGLVAKASSDKLQLNKKSGSGSVRALVSPRES